MDVHNLPKIIQEEIENLNSLVPVKEFEFITKNLPTKKQTSMPKMFHHWSNILGRNNVNPIQMLFKKGRDKTLSN